MTIQQPGTTPSPDQAPANAFPSILIGLFVVMLGIGGFGIWSFSADLSSAVIAQGEVKVLSNRKKVQTLEGGVVSELKVQNGDRVSAGDILVVLDRTRAAASHAIIQGNYDTARATISRLRAEREGRQTIQFPSDLVSRNKLQDIQDILEGEEKLFEARRASLQGQVSMVKERMGQLKEEITGLRAQEKAKERQIDLINAELASLRGLYEKGHAPLTRILALEREAAKLQGERGEHIAAVAQAKGLISEAKLESIQLEKNFIENVVTDLQRKESELFDLEERLNATAYMLGQTEIRATEEGTVVGLNTHTVGGILQPGATLLEIVPENDVLIVEAEIQPTDIDNVQLGLVADVQFTAFSQRTTPKVRGEVIYLSADRLIDPESKESIFVARIAISDQDLASLGGKPIQPGMPADVLIQTGERTPIDYLLKPIKDSMDKAWRES